MPGSFTLLPQPRSTEVGQGSFTFAEDLAITGPREWAAVVRRLLAPGTGLDLPGRDDGALRLHRDESLPDEGYRLEVTGDGIDVHAGDHRGLTWAVQTLRQLLPAAVYRPAPVGAQWQVPAVTITDAPRFAWRGLMLDVGRHFMPLADLYSFIDLLAMHKYNVFHLHLSEDQGWRMESKSHPRLHEVGSTRHQTRRPGAEDGDGTPHGGYYTQDQLRSLVSYAAQRGIEIVPELDFPGHVRAVLAAYPELSNNPGEGHTVADTFGIFDEVLNLSDEAMEFVFSVFTELLDVFPSRYIHAGGDEAPRTEWLASRAAAALAERRGLPDASHLQNWFTRQVRDWLAERGRVLVGWDEINDEGHLDGAVTMAWRGAGYGVEAARAGGEVVMVPTSHLYLDYYQSNDPDEPYSIGGHLPVEKVYAFDPLEGVPPEHSEKILGTQANVWTEYIPTMRRAQYHLFPRACAHAEVAWSDPAGRTWDEFTPRLIGHLERLDAVGVNYRPLGGLQPWQRGGTGAFERPAAHLGDADGQVGE
ncbi:beta-N-acetylhexosaminidase [Pseudactinotalea sp. Z1732]|uniref:beta-N-acetylhexosaminidase n=1 Tax=Pseudactinotalea sp. Z1732 TaxID=3413026 RepID=UPI003C7EB841